MHMGMAQYLDARVLPVTVGIRADQNNCTIFFLYSHYACTNLLIYIYISKFKVHLPVFSTSSYVQYRKGRNKYS